MRGIGTTAGTKEQICTSWCNGQVRQHNSLTPWADHTNTPGICAALLVHTRNTGYRLPTACGTIRRLFHQPFDFTGSRGRRLFPFTSNHLHVVIQITGYGQLKIALIWCTTGVTLKMRFCGSTMVTATLPNVNLVLSTVDGVRKNHRPLLPSVKSEGDRPRSTDHEMMAFSR